jgi:hypothetical protein
MNWKKGLMPLWRENAVVFSGRQLHDFMDFWKVSSLEGRLFPARVESFHFEIFCKVCGDHLKIRTGSNLFHMNCAPARAVQPLLWRCLASCMQPKVLNYLSKAMLDWVRRVGI